MTSNTFVWQSYFSPEPEISISHVIRTQTQNSFLNIMHDSFCLTNNLPVDKREEENCPRIDKAEVNEIC